MHNVLKTNRCNFVGTLWPFESNLRSSVSDIIFLKKSIMWIGQAAQPFHVQVVGISSVSLTHHLLSNWLIYRPFHVQVLGRGHIILTSREFMWCYACGWDVRGDLTLKFMAQIYTSVTLLTSRDLTWITGRLTCQHVSRPELHVRSRDVSRVTEV